MRTLAIVLLAASAGCVAVSEGAPAELHRAVPSRNVDADAPASGDSFSALAAPPSEEASAPRDASPPPRSAPPGGPAALAPATPAAAPAPAPAIAPDEPVEEESEAPPNDADPDGNGKATGYEGEQGGPPVQPTTVPSTPTIAAPVTTIPEVR